MHEHTVAPEGWERLLLPFVAVCVVGWSLLALTWPLSGDAGVFSWMADTVIRGGAPYVNAWDTKGPASWLPSWLMQRITGRNAWGIRAFDIVMLLLALAALRSIGRRLGLASGGRIAMALYALWYASLDYWASGQPDGWAASWLVTACALALGTSPVALFTAGALVAFAALSKVFYIGYMVVVIAVVVLSADRWSTQRTFGALLPIAGAATVVALVLLLLQHWGGLDAFWDAQRWTRDVYAQLGEGWMARLPAGYRFVLLMPSGIVVPLALYGAVYAPISRRRMAWPFVVAFGGALAGVMLQGKFWQYHGLPLLPFLALLADFGFTALRRELAGQHAATFRSVALALAVVTGMLTPLQQFYRYVKSRQSAEAAAVYEKREFRYYGRHPGSAHALVDSLTRVGGPRASIMVWAMQLGPQFLANSRIPTRFAVIRPLFNGEGSVYRERYRAEHEAGIRAAPPRWWLLPSASLKSRESELLEWDVKNYPEMARFLRDNYHEVRQTEEWIVFEQNVSRNTMAR
jgi:hypothetical protein